CAAFQHLIDAAGVERVVLPPPSPHLNAYAERGGRAVKNEALSRLILFWGRSLWHVLPQYVAHYYHQRTHEGKENVLLFPSSGYGHKGAGLVQCRERLGGLLKYYDRDAA